MTSLKELPDISTVSVHLSGKMLAIEFNGTSDLKTRNQDLETIFSKYNFALTELMPDEKTAYPSESWIDIHNLNKIIDGETSAINRQIIQSLTESETITEDQVPALKKELEANLQAVLISAEPAKMKSLEPAINKVLTKHLNGKKPPSMKLLSPAAVFKIEKQASVTKVNSVKVNIKGMHCGGCSFTVHKSLTNVTGFVSDNIQFPNTIGYVAYDPDQTSPKKLVRAITKSGFETHIID
ncbi:MAG: heavy-metal-associated domain-containing protein [Bacteroidetes bacterium]|nr:heavy-metal-associated domain-containing protein [Bacteroidota bacterium]